MQVIIDIPEDGYNIIKNYTRHLTYLEYLIKNGTPLPKGHGRLIDADRVITEATEKMKYPSNYEYMECVIAHMNLAPTIVEADRSDEE